MIYLASPYSSPSNILVERRYNIALAVCAALTNQHFAVYSPIVHWHEVARRFKLKTNAAFWWSVNKEFLDCAKSLVIISVPGWEQSVGVKQEAHYAEAVGLPISWIDPRKSSLEISPNPANLRILLGEPPSNGENIPQRVVGREDPSKPN